MLYALNDPLASFVFIDCIIVWKFMLKCVLRVRIKIYIIYIIFKNNTFMRLLKHNNAELYLTKKIVNKVKQVRWR